MQKVCCRCKLSKDLDLFNNYSSSKDGKQPHCRECASAYYKGNAIQHKSNVSRRNKKVRAFVQENVRMYLESHPCVDCGEIDPIVLEFDHMDRSSKLKAIGDMSGYSWDVILAEIQKCEVRCANCHRRKTATQMGWYKNLTAPRGPIG